MKRLISIAWLTAIWVVLWGQLDVRSLAGGLLVSTLLVVGLPSQEPLEVDAFRPLKLLRFLVSYAGLVVKSNAIIAWEIVTPGSKIREGIVAVPLHDASDLVVSLLAHAIGGTPGTLVVDVDRGDRTVLYVHILHLRTIDQARRDILDLARGLVTALGTERSLRDVERQIAAITDGGAVAPTTGEEEAT